MIVLLAVIQVAFLIAPYIGSKRKPAAEHCATAAG